MIDTGGISGSSGRQLIYVHGRDFKPPPEDLLDIVVAAISAGMERDCPDQLPAFHAIGKNLGYFGDLTNALLMSKGEHYDPLLDAGDRRNALTELRSLEKAKYFNVSRYDRLPGKTAVNEFTADIAAPILATLGLAGAVISKVAADLNEYWNDDSDFGSRIRERIRTPIMAALEQKQNVLLVSHGTGSIPTYDVLWQLSHHPDYAGRFADRKIDRWLTMGSPLGDTTVRRHLFGAGNRGRGAYPTNIMAWHNVSAEDDYCCHDNTLADDFREMLKLRLVSAIRDYRIYNLAVRYGKSNPHSSVGYLVHPRVARIVADWLGHKEAVTLPKSTL